MNAMHLLTRLGDVRLAIVASELDGFDATWAGPAVDLAQHLGLEVDPDAARRVGRIRGSDRRVVLGSDLRFVAVSLQAMHRCPALVQDHLRDLGIDALVALDDGFAYLLSLHGLRDA
jgi:hypothetical protein